MHLAGFTIEIYYDARPYERQFFLTLYFTSYSYFLYFSAPAHCVLGEEFPEISKHLTSSLSMTTKFQE